ncbi:MAG: phosphoglycerate kinase, partial [Pseudomonadota bacterium]
TDATRIERIVPTVTELLDKGGNVVLLAHFGRPKGEPVEEFSLKQLLPALEDAFGMEVAYWPANQAHSPESAPGGPAKPRLSLAENTRFDPGEEDNSPALAERWAAWGDIFVNDAFSAAHRAHASTVGLAELLPAYAGRQMEAELKALEAGLGSPETPVIAIVGGAKVSTKLDLLGNLVEKVDHLVIGGGMANTFLAALGTDVGKSLCEHDLADTARAIMAKAADANCEIILPTDVVVAEEFKANSPNKVRAVADVPTDGMILDCGPETIELIGERIRDCRTLVWNGPLGAFEIEPFDKATVLTAQEAARATQKGGLVSVAGGGDTVAALNHAGVTGDFSYVSTAGGAFLEWMEGKTLPGVAALETSMENGAT